MVLASSVESLSRDINIPCSPSSSKAWGKNLSGARKRSQLKSIFQFTQTIQKGIVAYYPGLRYSNFSVTWAVSLLEGSQTELRVERSETAVSPYLRNHLPAAAT